jgi:carbohydrate-binding DOMON domain-containing protein
MVLCFSVYMSERLNSLGQSHWQKFATQGNNIYTDTNTNTNTNTSTNTNTNTNTNKITLTNKAYSLV